MSPEVFLMDVRLNWVKRVADGELEGLSQEEKELVRGWEESVDGEFLELSNIICNCTNRFQFAKTYKVLRADAQKTLRDMLDPNIRPDISPKAKRLTHDITARVFDRKFTAMSRWFTERWSDNIETYAKPVGCASVLVYVLLTATAVIAALMT